MHRDSMEAVMKEPSSRRRYWEGVVADYEAVRGEFTLWDFAQARGLTFGTFKDWLYKLRKERREDEELRLVPVVLGPPGSPECSPVEEQQTRLVDAAFPGGMLLRFEAGTDAGYMAELLGSLAGRLR